MRMLLDCSVTLKTFITLAHVALLCMYDIRPSVDGLCREGPSEISRDLRT